MFLRLNADINFYFKRFSLTKYLNEYNLMHKSKRYINSVEKKINDKNMFTYFKYWILWRWINLNFKISESFINKLNRNIKKLSLSITAKEEKFIRDLEELVFNSWRPLKELPVRFSLTKKEKINLVQTNVNVHLFRPEKKEKQIKWIGKYDCYFSKNNIFLTDSNQNLKKEISNASIIDVKIENYGVIIILNKVKFLFRAKNRLLTYVLLQRMIPRLNLNINKIKNLYGYFGIWNNLFSKIV